jgi:hypothetical protein
MCSERTARPPEVTPRAASRGLDRRDFLKLSGSGLLGVALLGSVGVGKVFAQAEPSLGSSLVAEFREAAEEYGVPMEVLMAIGYVNTRWEMPAPVVNAYEEGNPHGWGSYGIMALVQNPYSNTLGEASRLTGIPEEHLRTDRAANIRGAAALLASAVGRVKSGLWGYFGAVAGRGLAGGMNYVAVAGIGSGGLYAEQVFEVLQTGASGTTLSGENIFLPARASTFVVGGT